jgi:hypothetical protein
MSEQIPFTTGALKDWPVIEEIVDQALAQALQGASGEDVRQEVLDNVRGAYAAANGSMTLTLSLPPLPVSPTTTAEIERRLRHDVNAIVAWFHGRLAAALGERITAAVEIVQLRRRLRELGEDV